jgi:hypothetical protein
MFFLDRKSKIVLAACFTALLCSIVYLIGYSQATRDFAKAQDNASMPKDTRLGISAETFIPNFNAYSEGLHISSYSHVHDDFIEFANNSDSVLIIGKGDTSNLDSIGVIFPKYDRIAYIQGMVAIYATISSVSPSTSQEYRQYIVEQLGLMDDVNNASGMKLSDYNGKRYAVTYDKGRVSFMSMVPKE